MSLFLILSQMHFANQKNSKKNHHVLGSIVFLFYNEGKSNDILDIQSRVTQLPGCAAGAECLSLLQFSSAAQSRPTLCNPMDCSMPGLHVHHQLPEFPQTHAHWVCDAIQPSHPLSSPSPPTFNLSHHHGLLKWVRSSHQVARVSEFLLQHQSFQWILRTDFL